MLVIANHSTLFAAGSKERAALESLAAGSGTQLLHELSPEAKDALLSWSQAHAVLLQVSAATPEEPD